MTTCNRVKGRPHKTLVEPWRKHSLIADSVRRGREIPSSCEPNPTIARSVELPGIAIEKKKLQSRSNSGQKMLNLQADQPRICSTVSSILCSGVSAAMLRLSHPDQHTWIRKKGAGLSPYPAAWLLSNHTADKARSNTLGSNQK